jgi:hypothetical protein
VLVDATVEPWKYSIPLKVLLIPIVVIVSDQQLVDD